MPAKIVRWTHPTPPDFFVCRIGHSVPKAARDGVGKSYRTVREDRHDQRHLAKLCELPIVCIDELSDLVPGLFSSPPVLDHGDCQCADNIVPHIAWQG